MIPYLKLPTTKDITIRGELIMSKETFEKIQDKRCKCTESCIWFLNRKTVSASDIRSLDFVAYEVIKPELKPSAQFDLLKTLDVISVIHQTTETISNESLSELLVEWREKHINEIDGVIYTNDAIYPREKENPKHAFALDGIIGPSCRSKSC